MDLVQLETKSPLPIIISYGNAQTIDVTCYTRIVCAHTNTYLANDGIFEDVWHCGI